eukprot:6182786-Lingulodinium_polyedra.AAC.1
MLPRLQTVLSPSPPAAANAPTAPTGPSTKEKGTWTNAITSPRAAAIDRGDKTNVGDSRRDPAMANPPGQTN